MSSENKMGVMPINKLILSMSIPMMLSMLIQALYNIVDSMFVAQISENAPDGRIPGLPGTKPDDRRSYWHRRRHQRHPFPEAWAKKLQKANRIAIHALFLAFMSFLAFRCFRPVFAEHFFLAQTRDPEIVEMGTVYLQICTVLSFGLFGEIAFERLMQSTGRTFYSMIIQGTGAILNIILDPIMIFWSPRASRKWGVAGAALATVTGQIIAPILGFVPNTTRNHEIHLAFKGFRPEKEIIGHI